MSAILTMCSYSTECKVAMALFWSFQVNVVQMCMSFAGSEIMTQL